MPATKVSPPRFLRPAGESGRALGLTHAIRFPVPEGEWCWAPEEGRLLPPSPFRPMLPEPAPLRRELEEHPPGAVLVGPFLAGQAELAAVLADRLEEAGWVVALAGVDGAAGRVPDGRGPTERLRFDATLGGARGSLPALVPVLPETADLFGLPRAIDHGVPLSTSREELRAIVDFADTPAAGGRELTFDRLLHRSEGPLPPELLPAIRPLPWPRGAPDLATWVGARLRSEAFRRAFSGAEGAAAELFGAARRVETMIPPLDRIAAAGLLGGVPGLGAEPLRLLEEILRG